MLKVNFLAVFFTAIIGGPVPAQAQVSTNTTNSADEAETQVVPLTEGDLDLVAGLATHASRVIPVSSEMGVAPGGEEVLLADCQEGDIGLPIAIRRWEEEGITAYYVGPYSFHELPGADAGLALRLLAESYSAGEEENYFSPGWTYVVQAGEENTVQVVDNGLAVLTLTPEGVGVEELVELLHKVAEIAAYQEVETVYAVSAVPAPNGYRVEGVVNN